MEEIVGAAGGKGPGFFGIDDIVGHGRDFSGEFRTGEETTEGLDTHGKSDLVREVRGADRGRGEWSY